MDVQGLHDLARRAQELSGQVRATSDGVSSATGVVWQSTRAQRYRDDLAAEARGVRDAADELERSAAALRRHADDVQHRLDQLAAVQHLFMGALDDARRTLSDAAGDLAGAAGAVPGAALEHARQVVDAARHMPSPGSLDWGGFASRFR